MKQRGVTFIELIVVIVILGSCIPLLTRMLADTTLRVSRSESLADATFYAQQLMEEILAKGFDENDACPKTDSVNFSAADTDESKANKDTFDDIDDYVGATDPRVTTPAVNYSSSVAVDYVKLNNGAWQSCGNVNCVDNDALECDTDCTKCCFKRVTVKVSNTKAKFAKDVTLVTIVAGK